MSHITALRASLRTVCTHARLNVDSMVRCRPGRPYKKCHPRKNATFICARGYNSSATFPAESSGSDVPFYDVVIVGGGMAGRAMACALGTESTLVDQSILLLEQGKKPPKIEVESLGDHYSNRVCALSPGSKKLLSEFGAWNYVEDLRTRSVCRMQVWDACSDALISFSNPDMSDSLAYITENDVTVDALSRVLDDLGDRIDVHYQSGLKTLVVPEQGRLDQESWAQLELKDGSKIKCRLVIGADGLNSLVRTQSRLHNIRWNYDQSGVVATLNLSEPTDNNVAWQRFLPTGPIALLPLSSTHSSLVWSTSHDEAKNLVRLPEEEFVEAVNHAFWDDSKHMLSVDSATQFFDSFLSLIEPSGSSIRQLPPSIHGVQAGSRAMFPLGLGHATHYVKPRVALIGDAAHRVHPLAGQGINLGFGDVACLKEVLVKAVSIGADLGSINHLVDYETERQKHVIPIMMTIDGLKRLYSTENPALVLVRSLGLQATDVMKPIKKFFIQNAAG